MAITTPTGYTATKAKQACALNGTDPSRNQTDSKCDCAGASPCFICVTLTPANPVNLNIDKIVKACLEKARARSAAS